jgi:hypothetical protein
MDAATVVAADSGERRGGDVAAIVFVATAWGPRHGGINAFNQDLTCAVARGAPAGLEVMCVVLHATREDVEEAALRGVRLVSLG